MGGLEVILNNNCEVNFFDFIERNFVSKKVVYGWSKIIIVKHIIILIKKIQRLNS